MINKHRNLLPIIARSFYKHKSLNSQKENKIDANANIESFIDVCEKLNWKRKIVTNQKNLKNFLSMTKLH